MIRRALKKDKNQILTYLNQEPEYNIFIIGDIEAFGMETNFQFIYADFFEDGSILSVLLVYRIHVVYYSHESIFNPDYLKFLHKHNIAHISGKTKTIESMVPYVKGFIKRDMYFCKADTAESITTLNYYTLQTIDDCRELYDLLASITEFNTMTESKEEFAYSKFHSLQAGTILAIREKDHMVSTVEATAETNQSAMVIGVATKKGYRNKGYASKLMQVLMDIYINKLGKSLCLFYDNKSAGKIYKRLGFYDLGSWVTLDKEE